MGSQKVRHDRVTNFPLVKEWELSEYITVQTCLDSSLVPSGFCLYIELVLISQYSWEYL